MDSCCQGTGVTSQLDAENDAGPAVTGASSEEIARDSLVTENLSVINIVIRRLLPKLPTHIESGDLVGVGVLGLITAAQKFDRDRGAQFRTYAESRVRGAILDYLRSLSWAPRGLHRRAKAVADARSMVEQRTRRSASSSELAEELGLTPEECHRLLSDLNRLEVCGLEEVVSQSRCDPADDPATALHRKEMLGLISEAVDCLPERLKLVLWLYYCEELTMKEVGAVLGVNEPRASQLHSKAIGTIRKQVISLLGGELPAQSGPGRRRIK